MVHQVLGPKPLPPPPCSKEALSSIPPLVERRCLLRRSSCLLLFPSLVLAAFLALQQVGQHVLKDAFGNFVMDPLQDHAVDQVVANVPGANQAVDGYNQANGHAKYGAKIYNRINQMMNS